ncbi:unnamed protein product [Rhizoctonia solani]|uniref:Uncharacterized protein n=1 Tax=Rhizoctonia solani TaxID=456999 RepID=A0A8H3GI30_9AGAM|nr:unnamed protein product [Rhizoctonia solani]
MRFISLFVNVALTAGVIASPASVIRESDYTNLQSVEPVDDVKVPSQGLSAERSRALKTPVDNLEDFVPRAANETFKSCYIPVKDAKSGAILGYVGQRWRTTGWYGLEKPKDEQPLQVRFSYSPLDKSPSQLNFLAMNRLGPSGGLESIQNRENIIKYPYFGAAASRYSEFKDQFSPGNFGHVPLYKFANNELIIPCLFSAAIVGTKSTPPGSPPMHDDSSMSVYGGTPTEVESAIWIYDTKTKDIRAQWINADGSAPETNLIYLTRADAFAITSEANKFQAANLPVTFTCVSRPHSGKD